MSQSASSFSSAFRNLSFILKACWNELNLSIVVGLEMEFTFIEILLWVVQKTVSNGCSFFPLTPVILIEGQMFHDFAGIDIL
jgi:hypothetical protein